MRLHNRRLLTDAKKTVIGPLAGFRLRRCPIARRRTGAGLPVKVRLVRKSWCALCGGPGRPSEKYEPTPTCRGTSQNAFGKKDLAMELQRTIRHDSDSRCQKRETFVPSQNVIGEIRMASSLQTCPDSPTCGLQVAYRRLTPGFGGLTSNAVSARRSQRHRKLLYPCIRCWRLIFLPGVRRRSTPAMKTWCFPVFV